MDTVPDIARRARAHLNDQENQGTFTDSILLEFMNDAYEEIQEELILRDIPVVQEISASIPILANTPSTISRIQIPDLFFPVKLQEYPTGSSEDPTDIANMEWDSDIDPSDKILYYTWREGEIKIPQVTQNTSVIVKYKRLYTELDVDDSIIIGNVKRFLGYKTAALAAGPIGGRFDLAEFLMNEAEKAKDLFLSNSVKQIAKFGRRRKPFRRAYAHN